MSIARALKGALAAAMFAVGTAQTAAQTDIEAMGFRNIGNGLCATGAFIVPYSVTIVTPPEHIWRTSRDFLPSPGDVLELQKGSVLDAPPPCQPCLPLHTHQISIIQRLPLAPQLPGSQPPASFDRVQGTDRSQVAVDFEWASPDPRRQQTERQCATYCA